MPAAKKVVAPKKIREAKVPVTDANVTKAALRLLSHKLVSTEVVYVQRVLGSTATQQAIDTQVMSVRSLPWASIVQPD